MTSPPRKRSEEEEKRDNWEEGSIPVMWIFSAK